MLFVHGDHALRMAVAHAVSGVGVLGGVLLRKAYWVEFVGDQQNAVYAHRVSQGGLSVAVASVR